jgi:hypothetical protein
VDLGGCQYCRRDGGWDMAPVKHGYGMTGCNNHPSRVIPATTGK